MTPAGRRARTSTLVVSILAAVLATLLTSPPADASGLVTGFSRNDIFTYGSGDVGAAAWEARASSEGASIIRVAVGWAAIAPSTRPAGFDPADPNSPGYDWTSLDASVSSLAARGFTVLLTVQGAPTWAEDGTPARGTAAGAWRPDPKQFAAFATALATRYDGRTANPASLGTDLPKVRYFQGWNEPNLAIYLAPQWVRSGGAWHAESPILYRALANDFYTAVKRVSAADTVVLGATSAFGDPPGGARMSPVTFDTDLLSAATHFDVFDHHPSGLTGGPLTHAALPGDAAVPDLGRLTRVLAAAERDGHALPRGHKPIWITELFWNTDPPDRTGAVGLTTQADDLELAFYELWSEGASVILWEMMADDAPDPQLVDALQAGLYFENGGAKPSATAFAFPFVTRRTNRSAFLAWGRAPAAGVLAIERRQGGSWTTIRHLRVGRHEVFEATLASATAGTYRAVVGTNVSLDWSQAE